MRRILGVVDDEGMRHFLSTCLSFPQFDIVFSGLDESLIPVIFQNHFSMILVDLDYDRDIEEFCDRIKPFCEIPVVVLIWEGHEDTLTDYVKAGVSDCIFKPLKPAELRARINAALVRKAAERPNAEGVRCGQLRVNLDTRRVFRGNLEIKVSRTSYRLLVYFMQHQGQVISKEDLLRDVWRYHGSQWDFNLVESAVRRLRNDLGDDYRNPRCLYTVRGIGYRFEEIRDQNG